MTKILDIGEIVSIQSVVAFAKKGNEIVIEENGEPVAKITPIADGKQTKQKQRILGLGKGEGYFMSEDFDDELPDEFWGFDKEL